MLDKIMENGINARYERNIKALSVEEMHKLHAAKVCIIGSGGLGGYIVEILARIGVHNITLVDFDVFDTNNLNRQLLCEEALLGHPKADAAAARIQRVNSEVTLTPIKEAITAENASAILTGHDVVVDALDNIQTRLMLAESCRNLGIPLIHGSIAGWFGQVAVILPGDTTMEKMFGQVKAQRGIEKELGNLPFTASTVASLQAAEAVKVLVGKEVENHTVLQIDLLYGEYTRIALGK